MVVPGYKKKDETVGTVHPFVRSSGANVHNVEVCLIGLKELSKRKYKVTDLDLIYPSGFV